MKSNIYVFLLCALLATGCSSQPAQKDTSKTPAVSTNDSSNSSSSPGSLDPSESGAKDPAASLEPVSREIFAMDTYMTLTAYGTMAEEALDAAVSEIERLDALLSVGNSEGEIFLLNQNKTAVLSEDSKALLLESLALYDSTDGAFDITIYPLMEKWGFTTGNYHVPESDVISSLLKRVDASQITFDSSSNTIQLPDGVKLDFGGIAKGYTSQRVMEIFQSYDLTGGIVSLGGNVEACGVKPSASSDQGSLWHIAVEDPQNPSEYLGILELTDQAVITSGGYERYFEEDGTTYHHILDPKTGYPANAGLTSVSIISSDGMLADGLSTSLFIMGKEKAIQYWREHSDEFEMILVEEDGTISISSGLEKQFDSERSYEIIS